MRDALVPAAADRHVAEVPSECRGRHLHRRFDVGGQHRANVWIDRPHYWNAWWVKAPASLWQSSPSARGRSTGGKIARISSTSAAEFGGGSRPATWSACEPSAASTARAPSRHSADGGCFAPGEEAQHGDVVLAEAAEREERGRGDRARLLRPAVLDHVQRLDRPLVIADQPRGDRVLEEMIGQPLGELAEVGVRERPARRWPARRGRCGSRRWSTPRRVGDRRRAAGTRGCR